MSLFLVYLQLPIEVLCSLSSRSLFPAALPASTEDVLLKGFKMLGMEDQRIETAQQVRAGHAVTLVSPGIVRGFIADHCSFSPAVFLLVLQTAGPDGPRRRSQVQVCVRVVNGMF